MSHDALPRSWSAAVLVLSASLAALPYRESGAAFAIALGASVACGAAMLRRGGIAQALLVVVVSALSGLKPLGEAVAEPWLPFVAQHPGQGPWLAVRIVLLAALLLTAAAEANERRGVAVTLVATFATVATLAVRGLVVPWIAIASWMIGGASIPVPPFVARRARELLATAAAGALAITLVIHARPRTPGWIETMPKDPALASAEWRARGNTWRARYAALAWARSERGNPGKGHLALAQLELELGRRAAAKEVFRALETQTRDAALRDEARRSLATLEGDPSGGEAPR